MQYEKCKAMRHFEETINLFEDSSFFYIITVNMSGRYSYINNHYKKSFAHIEENMVDAPYQVTMHPDDTRVCEEVSAQCFANPNKVFPATIRKHDGKGGYLITQWEYKAIFNDNGEPAGMFCFGYDITKFVDEQQQLKAAETEIEKRRVVMNNIAFQHSHLIRAPLSNIMGLALILEKMEMDTNLRNICNMIVESSNQLDYIIREIVEKSYT